MDESDEFLIEGYLGGDDTPFKVLIDKYTNSIYNFSARFVGRDYASDITQDVFVKVWKNIKKFDKSKSSFKTWVFTITRNTITDYLRKKKTINFSSLDDEDGSFEDNIEDEANLPSEIVLKLEDEKILNNLIDQLPNNYKEVLILYYQEDMTFAEIGELLNKPLNTVKSHHRRALIALREKLDIFAPKL